MDALTAEGSLDTRQLALREAKGVCVWRLPTGPWKPKELPL